MVRGGARRRGRLRPPSGVEHRRARLIRRLQPRRRLGAGQVAAGGRAAVQRAGVGHRHRQCGCCASAPEFDESLELGAAREPDDLARRDSEAASAGAYILRYVVVDPADLHKTVGSISFGIGVAAPPSESGEQVDSSWLSIALRVISDGAALLAVGAVVVAALMVRSGRRRLRQRHVAGRALQRCVVAVGWIGLFVADAASVGFQQRSVVEPAPQQRSRAPRPDRRPAGHRGVVGGAPAAQGHRPGSASGWSFASSRSSPAASSSLLRTAVTPASVGRWSSGCAAGVAPRLVVRVDRRRWRRCGCSPAEIIGCERCGRRSARWPSSVWWSQGERIPSQWPRCGDGDGAVLDELRPADRDEGGSASWRWRSRGDGSAAGQCAAANQARFRWSSAVAGVAVVIAALLVGSAPARGEQFAPVSVGRATDRHGRRSRSHGERVDRAGTTRSEPGASSCARHPSAVPGSVRESHCPYRRRRWRRGRRTCGPTGRWIRRVGRCRGARAPALYRVEVDVSARRSPVSPFVASWQVEPTPGATRADRGVDAVVGPDRGGFAARLGASGGRWMVGDPPRSARLSPTPGADHPVR